MWRSIHNFVRHAVSRSPDGFHPLLAVHYLTYACPFRCPYCCDGQGVRYSDLRSPVLRTADVLAVYARIRRRCDALVITGGEPLDHPDAGEILGALPRLGFDRVVLATRGVALDPHLEAVEAGIDELVVSLDTLDPVKGDAWLGRAGAHAAILRNLHLLSSRPRRPAITVSSVATPDNLPDVAAVLDFAVAHGFRFAVSPQQVGVHPHLGLRRNETYRALLDDLIRRKRAGEGIVGTLAALEHLRELAPCPSCRPSTVLAVSPAGDVFYPCLELGQVAGNLLDEPDLDVIRAQGRRKYGPEPECEQTRHSPCALAPGLALARPWIYVDEGWRAVVGGTRRLLTPRPRRPDPA